MRKLKLPRASKPIVLSLLLLVMIGLGISAKDAQRITDSVASSFLMETQPGLYEVTYVFDGDTIEVRGTNGQVNKVRFIGIDTPEKNHPSKPVQCFAYAATEHLEQLLDGSDVKLIADATNSNRDRYDRLLRYVYLPDGTLLNAKMIEDGYAFAYTSFPVTKMNKFLALEQEAREANRGLWGSCQIEQDNGYLNTNPI